MLSTGARKMANGSCASSIIVMVSAGISAPVAAACCCVEATNVVMAGSKSCGKMKKYTAAPMMDRTAGPNQATANQGSAFLNPRGLMTLFLKPSPVTRRVISTPMAGKNMAAPVTNCAATGGMPVSAPDDTGYTTPNSYAHVNPNVMAKNNTILFIVRTFLSEVGILSERSGSRDPVRCR